MGFDKYESKLLKYIFEIVNSNFIVFRLIFFYILDEDLIKWGWPEDVWFHVDKVSSAHVYLRLKEVPV